MFPLWPTSTIPPAPSSIPEIEPVRLRHAQPGRRAPHVLGAVGQPARRAGAVPARRTRRGRRAGAPPLLRPRALPHRHLRPARGRPLDAARRAEGQHDPAPRRRHRAAARSISSIERWLVFGGSWGSTLALAYGEAHPDRCTGFILRGVFLCRASEIDWFIYGLRNFFPEAWRTVRGRDPRGRARRSAARLLPAPDRSGSRGAHGGGARLVELRGRVLDAAAEPGHGRLLRRGHRGAGARAHRGALLHARHLPAAERAARERARAYATFPAPSCRAATTPSALSSPPTICTTRGRKPSTSSSRRPATRRGSPASARSW